MKLNAFFSMDSCCHAGAIKGVVRLWEVIRPTSLNLTTPFGARHEPVSNRSTNQFPIGPRTGFRQVHKPVSNRSTIVFLQKSRGGRGEGGPLLSFWSNLPPVVKAQVHVQDTIQAYKPDLMHGPSNRILHRPTNRITHRSTKRTIHQSINWITQRPTNRLGQKSTSQLMHRSTNQTIHTQIHKPS